MPCVRLLETLSLYTRDKHNIYKHIAYIRHTTYVEYVNGMHALVTCMYTSHTYERHIDTHYTQVACTYVTCTCMTCTHAMLTVHVQALTTSSIHHSVSVDNNILLTISTRSASKTQLSTMYNTLVRRIRLCE